MNEFSQIVFARVGFNSAVQGKVDIPEGATKLLVVFPQPEDNRNDKHFERKILPLSDEGFGVCLMDLWDEDECCDSNIITNENFLQKRIEEILTWCKGYDAFAGAEIIAIGVEKTGEVLKNLSTIQSIAITNKSQKDVIVKLIKEL